MMSNSNDTKINDLTSNLYELIQICKNKKYVRADILKSTSESLLLKLFPSNQLTGKLAYKATMAVNRELLNLVLERWGPLEDLRTGKATLNEKIFKDFFVYMKENIRHAGGIKEKCVAEVTTTDRPRNLENVMLVQSTFKNLKTLFYYEPQKHPYFYSNPSLTNNDVAELTTQFRYVSGNYVLNYPFVNVKLDLPGLQMARRIVCKDEFTLFNLQREYLLKNVDKRDTGLFSHPNGGDKEEFSSSLLSSYLQQLMDLMNSSADIPKHVKVNMCLVLAEFQKDVNLCYDVVNVDTLYQINLTKYPYIRFMGKPTQSNSPRVLVEDQLLLDNSDLNVRLQQVTHPSLYFFIKKFVPVFDPDESGKFLFDEGLLTAFKYKAITFECTLCKKTGKLNDMRFHIIVQHGVEPDWSCTICKQTFSAKHLSLTRWIHECQE